METFYSLIYYKTNALTDEMLAIGMVAGGGEGPFFYLSEQRMKLLKTLLAPNLYKAVVRHFKAFGDKVDANRKEAAGVLLFDPVFSVGKLKEIAEKNNGNILYSQPTTVNEWLDETAFDTLVQSFMGEGPKR